MTNQEINERSARGGKFLACAIMAALIAAGFLIGSVCCEDYWKRQCVQRGVVEWYAEKDGAVEWRWK